MKISPINVSFGRYYNFKTNDPRIAHPNFRLGMPDKEVVETVSSGDNYYYPVTAEQLRARYIKQQGYNYETHYPDNHIVGVRFDSGAGHDYFVTAGQVREEILEEEEAQLKYEQTHTLSDELLEKVAGGKIIDDIPSWDRYPY